ncbi:hypothetical protein ACNFJN_00425 [Xenorhabdus budapestensis]|uniref:hypothetical protein n=1 Tax=Xenorhabdus budapestensis TaxID=290110 RepID=UPI003A84CE0E
MPVENGSKFTRGKKKVREEIAFLVEIDFEGEVLDGNEYRVFFYYADKADVKEQIDSLLEEVYRIAEWRHCVVI